MNSIKTQEFIPPKGIDPILSDLLSKLLIKDPSMRIKLDDILTYL